MSSPELESLPLPVHECKRIGSFGAELSSSLLLLFLLGMSIPQTRRTVVGLHFAPLAAGLKFASTVFFNALVISVRLSISD